MSSDDITADVVVVFSLCPAPTKRQAPSTRRPLDRMLLPVFSLTIALRLGSTFAANVTAPLTLRPQQAALNFSYTVFPPVSSFTQFDNIPASCAASAIDDCPAGATMSSVYVTYGDCADPWTLCHCSASQITLEEAIYNLGGIPVGLRRFVGTVIVMPDLDDSPHAYTLVDVGEIHIFGACNQRTWVHESTHTYDYSLGVHMSKSGSAAWAYAVESDSCVPDRYAQSNLVEDFAQMSVLKTYQMQNGHLPPGYAADCMENQLAYLSSLTTFNTTTMFGNTCSITNGDGARHSPIVEPSAVSRQKDKAAGNSGSYSFPHGHLALVILSTALSWFC